VTIVGRQSCLQAGVPAVFFGFGAEEPARSQDCPTSRGRDGRIRTADLSLGGDRTKFLIAHNGARLCCSQQSRALPWLRLW